jgi:two-component sensor histidine kinase
MLIKPFTPHILAMRIPVKQLREFMVRRREPSLLGSAALSVSCVAVAFVVRFLLTPIAAADSAYATFYPAILLSTLVGGRVAGSATIILSFVAGWWAFVEPLYALAQPAYDDILHMALFVVASLVIFWLALQYRRTVSELTDSEIQRRLLADEVHHRARNAASVIAAIVLQTVKDKELAETLVNRIRASLDAKSPLGEEMQSSDLRELLVETVQRKHGQNILLNGPAVRLREPEARNLRLVFHEMSTNAAKYGALSRPAGKVDICWSAESNRVNVVWCESGGPKVAPPDKRNFGSRLITTMVEDLNGSLEPTFAETGYCYRISMPVGGPEQSA